MIKIFGAAFIAATAVADDYELLREWCEEEAEILGLKDSAMFNLSQDGKGRLGIDWGKFYHELEMLWYVSIDTCSLDRQQFSELE